MIVHDDNTTNVVYVHKGVLHEKPPMKHYYVDGELIKGSTKFVTIRRAIPMFIHILIWVLMVIPIIGMVYLSYRSTSNQVRTHTIRVPSEMYYDSRSNTIDLDITNDESNFETISISLIDSDGDIILNMNGIRPGESIGAWPIGDYTFDSLPATCTISYNAEYNGSVFKEITKSVLIVDREVADAEENREF